MPGGFENTESRADGAKSPESTMSGYVDYSDPVKGKDHRCIAYVSFERESIYPYGK